jgi:NTE family protein
MTVDADLTTVNHLGLALGGGVALGAAHVGVLQVLHERGIHPTIVAGTSVGSIMGGLYALGIDPYRLEVMVSHAQWGNLAWPGLNPCLGVLDQEGLRRTIEQIGGDVLIEDLPIAFAAVATDLVSRTPIILDRGNLADAMCASIAIPGVFRPTIRDGFVLVDGGLVENLPLEAVFEMGAAHVIGVRLAPEWDGLPDFHTSVHVHELEIRSDVTLIHPGLGGKSMWRLKDLADLIVLGRKGAEQRLAEYPVVNKRPKKPPKTT